MKRIATYRHHSSLKNEALQQAVAQWASKWYCISAKDQRLGRLATTVARLLRGKNKPIYDPSCDHGDFVVIVDAEGIVNTSTDKVYHWHTGFPGGLKSETFEKRRARRPDYLIREAVRGMLPKGPLGYRLLKKLKVYAGQEHPHVAQQPEWLNLKDHG